MRTVTMLLLLLLVTVVAGCTTRPSTPPRLNLDATVAADFRALADETWAQFLITFAARSNCFGDVTLRTARKLESRALYDPKTATVTVRVPGTPAFLQAALIHEWAHHIEFQCDEHHTIRPAIVAALDLPPNTAWWTDHAWAESPSEQYAEATVELVLGDHPLPTKIWVDPKIVTIVADWSMGN